MAQEIDPARKEQVVGHVSELFARGNIQIPVPDAQAIQVMNSAAHIMQADIVELVTMLRTNPAAAAELLRTANSAMFRRSAEVVSLEDAIIRIGRREAYAIMATLATRSLFEPALKRLQEVLKYEWYRQQQHAVVSAYGVAWLAAKVNAGSYERAFWSGMFHDIGMLGALTCLCASIVDGKVTEAEGLALVGPVLQELHVAFGSKMLTGWNLPGDLAEICRKHHKRLEERDPMFKMVNVVNVISTMDILQNGHFKADSLQAEMEDGLQFLKLKPSDILDKVKATTDHVARLLGPSPPNPYTVSQLV